MIYRDRYGAPHHPTTQSARCTRIGAFGLFVHQDKILLNIEAHAPDCADIPGGGIDTGESPLEATLRELTEETGLTCPPDLSPTESYQQHVPFYAENSDVFCDYTMHYVLFQDPALNALYFEGHRPNPDGYYAFWHPLSDLSGICLHHFHKTAITHILDL